MIKSNSRVWLGQAVLGVGLSVGVCQPALAADGKKVYEATCIACHATGVGNAPKLGDKAAWAPRTGAGREVLVKSVVAGKGVMPAKAGNPKLTDAEIRAAVDYMLASLK